MDTAKRLWFDEGGEASAMSLILIATIIGLGAIVGVATYRDQLVQEFGDLGVSLERLDQSFSAPHYGTFVDTVTATDTAGQPPDDINFVDP
jgi:hypothetical protein